MILQFAKEQGIDVVEWFEQVGAEPMHYPYQALDKALEYCENNVKVEYLLVADMNRISRSLAPYIYWTMSFDRIGVDIKSIASPDDLSPLDGFMERLMSVQSQLERQLHSDAIKRGLQRKKLAEKPMEE